MTPTRRSLATALFTLLLGLTAQAEPLVTGYERFHADQPSREGGALLYSELGCANCHAKSPGLPDRRGPLLADLKSRVNADWIDHFLTTPQEAKPGTMMPALFDALPAEERAAQIEAVTHYLMTLKPLGAATKTKSARHSNAERGSARYHQVGCVACHAPTPDFHPAIGAPKPEEYTSRPIPFPDLKAKYSLFTLASFLENPSATRPDGRMPHLGLNADDALDIACHLFDYRPSDPRESPGLTPFKADGKKAKQGAEIAARLNCAACHTLTTDDPPVQIPIKDTSADAGCLSTVPTPGRPHYSLSPAQRQSLALYVGGTSPAFSTTQKADLTLKALNCYACHDRDGLGGPDIARNRYFVGDEGIADAGRLAPPLTGIGKKLRPDWLESVFKGTGRVRPYLQTQMPIYASHAKALSKLLIEADPKDLPPLAEGDVTAGHKLVGIQGGVNCITCHTWGDKPSLGIQALDISDLDKRLNPDWFRDYLLNPAAYRPGTLMPPLWPGGQSMVKDVLGGDSEQQIAAIWAFIKDGEGLPEGYPEHIANAFELIPTDRPILQRTFLKNVGPHAILAGFPGGIHIAYDGDKGRPALTWRGRFFDAYSTWFVRAAPFEDPLEKEVFAWPKASDTDPAGYRGYKLDSQGNPTFLSTQVGIEIEDHYTVIDGQLHRTLSWPTGKPEPTWTHPEGLTQTAAPSPKPNQRTFIYSWQ
jgi:mono/diheme cytochrome c family protein